MSGTIILFGKSGTGNKGSSQHRYDRLRSVRAERRTRFGSIRSARTRRSEPANRIWCGTFSSEPPTIENWEVTWPSSRRVVGGWFGAYLNQTMYGTRLIGKKRPATRGSTGCIDYNHTFNPGSVFSLITGPPLVS